MTSADPVPSKTGFPGVLIIAGQTAVGKSAVALALAEQFGAELVGADSRQVYRRMPIGTAAPDEMARARAAHHLVDFLEPRERYSAARFVRDAIHAITEITARQKCAIVVGGTGFYIRALCGDVGLCGAFDGELRDRLAREVRLHPRAVLHEWLSAIDSQAAERLEPGDVYRVTRALEIALSERSATVGSAERPHEAALPTLRARGIPFIKVLLTADPEQLSRNIEERVDRMLAAGFVAEAEQIGPDVPAAGAVGYPQAIAYARGRLSHAELRRLLIRQTRRYAKRQATWFRSEPGLETVEADTALVRLTALAREKLGWTSPH